MRLTLVRVCYSEMENGVTRHTKFALAIQILKKYKVNTDATDLAMFYVL